MLTTLYVFQFIITALLVLLIFVQKRQETTSLLSSNSYNSMFKNMAVAPNPFVKFTIGLGVLFFVNSIIIGAVLLKQSRSHDSVVDKAAVYSSMQGKAKSAKAVPSVSVPLGQATKQSKKHSTNNYHHVNNHMGSLQPGYAKPKIEHKVKPSADHRSS